MAAANVTCGEERIADELQLKLGRSPPTLAEIHPQSRRADCELRLLRGGHGPFHTLYVFVIMEATTQRILLTNVTAHPTAEWTLQQFREAPRDDHSYRFVFHDRDSIFSKGLDRDVTDMGVRALRTPVRAPMANSICQRLGGSLPRECLHFVIPFSERDLRAFVKLWRRHYNRGTPHASLGPGFP